MLNYMVRTASGRTTILLIPEVTRRAESSAVDGVKYIELHR